MFKKWWVRAVSILLVAILIAGTFAFLSFRVNVSPEDGYVSISLQSNVAYAATESLAPTGQVTWTNLDGSYLDIDDDPDSPDANWGDAVSDSSDVLAHVNFDTPTGNPTVGAGLQNFKIWVKRSTALSSPTVKIDLYESGIFRSATSVTSSSVTSDAGELFTGTWNAGSLGTADGSVVEAYIYGTKAGASGSTSTGAEYPTSEVSLSSDPHLDNDWEITGELDINDDVYTEITDKSYDIGDQTYLLKVYGFDFSGVPNDATIVGVEVNIAGYYAVGTSSFDYMKLMDISRNPVGNDVLTPGPTQLVASEATSTFGSSSVLWGNSLTPAWVKDADFGVCLGMIADGNNADLYLDWLTMEVFYTDGDTYSSVDVGAVEWNVDYTAGAPEISVSPTSYNFGVVQEGSTTNTTTGYFTITNASTIQTDQTISVTTATWSGTEGWLHNDSGSPGDNATAILANRGGTWGVGDVIVKNVAPNYIYENCPALESYSFGLGLWSPTVNYDGSEKTIIVRVSAVAG